MIRKLVALALLALLARRLLRGRGPVRDRVSVGFVDGSEIALEPGAPGHGALLGAAREALLP